VVTAAPKNQAKRQPKENTMNLLNAISPIINSKTAKVTLEVSANPKAEGQLVVLARPVTGPVSDKAPEELKQLCAALATPIKVIGTPEDIEQALAAAVAEQTEARNSWASRAASLEAQIAAGAQADQKGAAKAPATPAPAKTPATAAKEQATAEATSAETAGTADDDDFGDLV
jgi:PRTRC genetic system protein E